MAKESEDNSQQNDQYNYSEEQYSSEEVYPVKKNVDIGGAVSKAVNTRKRLMVGIALAVLFFIIFRLFNAFQHKGSLTKPPENKPPVTTVTPITNPVVKHPIDTTPVVSNPGNERPMVDNSQQVNKLQQDINKMQQDMQLMQNQMVNLNNSVQEVRYLLYQQMRMIKLQQYRALEQARKQAPAYQVYAVIPNRAWIVGPKGVIYTVRIGSELPGAGIVKDIDIMQGTVTTSLGLVIKYALDDT